MTLQRRIAVLLAERDWSQSDAAHEMGMSRTMFNQRYRGHMDFRVHEIVRLAGLFDVPVEELTRGLEETQEYQKANMRGRELRERERFIDD